MIAFTAQTLATLFLFLVVSQSLIQTLSLRRLMAIYDTHVSQMEIKSEVEVRQFLDLTRWIESVTYASSRGIWLPSVLILAYAWGRLPIWDGWGINSALVYFTLMPLAVTI